LAPELDKVTGRRHKFSHDPEKRPQAPAAGVLLFGNVLRPSVAVPTNCRVRP
jgi:hypothetical protein